MNEDLGCGGRGGKKPYFGKKVNWEILYRFEGGG